MSYKEEHLNVKKAECAKLWYEWYACWKKDRQSDETKKLRSDWNACVSAHSEMIHQEYLKMKEKYGDVL